jgi:predicted O-methyltransferase YrrM
MHCDLVEASRALCADLGLGLQDFLAHVQDAMLIKPDVFWTSSMDECKLLYALTRMMRPERALEIGTGGQCSAWHIGRAMEENGVGTLISVDPRIDRPLRPVPRTMFVVGDGIQYSWYEQGPLDFLFEDGPHAEGFTEMVLRGCLPRLKRGGIVLVHDFEHTMAGPWIRSDCKKVLGRDLPSVQVGDSECGIGWWRKM